MRLNFSGYFRLIFLLLLTTAIASYRVSAQTAVQLNQTSDNFLIKENIQLLEDKDNKLTIDDVARSADWKLNPDKGILNFSITPSTHWIKVSLHNNTTERRWLFKISQPILDEIHFYEYDSLGHFKETVAGEAFPFHYRQYPSTDFFFFVDLPQGATKTYFFKARNTDNFQVPLFIGTEQNMLHADKNKDIFWWVYIGLILSMLLYNLFIFVSVKDRSYLYYFIYLVAVLLTQTTIAGYTFQYLWPGSKWMATHSSLLLYAFVGMAGMSFVRNFLHVKEKRPLFDKLFYIFYGGYALGILLGILDKQHLAFKITNMCASFSAFFVLIIAFVLSRKSYRPARFFIIAWTVFLIGVLVYTVKDFGVIPYNTFTLYTMPVGSAMEAILLSFALADKINALKREKEEILKDQNVQLELLVTERTRELEISLQNLKEAQAQLVESEKMASLGQLTAGIAHEINNPINFVTSNVRPLRRDFGQMVEMYDRIEHIAFSEGPVNEKKKQVEELKEEYDFDYLKTEVESLLDGISEGSSRTAEIVKGLRIFSRLDEDDLKNANIIDGINSTLLILNAELGGKIELVQEYDKPVMAECYPGKLNQVFMNIITNAIHAIRARFDNNKGGKLTIGVVEKDNFIQIKISDNGTGMSEETKRKIFEPFFTTKDVGQGTGLGLSIVYNTIQKHHGNIEVNSIVGEGTTFIITIPNKQ